jgi:hypothetical protein
MAETHFDSSTQPPPTRTMTVRERSIRQKHNFARPSAPIQYLPDSSLHSSTLVSEPTGRMGTLTFSLFTILPTATSSLFFGLGIYPDVEGFGVVDNRLPRLD